MRPLFTLQIPEDLIRSLNKSGFQNVEDLSGKDNECLDEALEIIKSFGFTWDDIKVLLNGPGHVSAAQILRREQFTESIPTFSEALDKILGGGVHTDTVLQICGPPGSGKTQMVLQLSVNVQIPVSLGGLGAEAIFIDTEGTFSPHRIREIASGAALHCNNIAELHNVKEEITRFSTDYIISNIHYVGVGNLLQLISSLHRLPELLSNNRNIKLVIIDSFTFPFLKTEHLERTRQISTLLQSLHSMASEYNLAIVITNHLTTKVNQESTTLAPSLGESFTHMIPNCLLLGIVENNFSGALYKSNKLQEEVTHFKICSNGIRDI